MSKLDEIEDELREDAIQEDWQEAVSGMVEDEEEQEKFISWIKESRDEFLEFAEIVDDDEELRQSLHDKYISLYSRWKLLNTKMNYQAVNAGGPDPEVMIKGALITSVLERVESVIDDELVDEIQEFLTSPEAYVD